MVFKVAIRTKMNAYNNQPFFLQKVRLWKIIENMVTNGGMKANGAETEPNQIHG